MKLNKTKSEPLYDHNFYTCIDRLLFTSWFKETCNSTCCNALRNGNMEGIAITHWWLIGVQINLYVYNTNVICELWLPQLCAISNGPRPDFVWRIDDLQTSHLCHSFSLWQSRIISNSFHFLLLSCASSSAVVDLVYWRKLRRTGVVFTGLVMSLASLFQLSAITVISHICLGVMAVTFTLRLYYKLLELLRWNPGVHPFEWVCQHWFILTYAFIKIHLTSNLILILF